MVHLFFVILWFFLKLPFEIVLHPFATAFFVLLVLYGLYKLRANKDSPVAPGPKA